MSPTGERENPWILVDSDGEEVSKLITIATKSVRDRPNSNVKSCKIYQNKLFSQDEDPDSSWQYLQENDLVALLNQIPLADIFRHVLQIEVVNGIPYIHTFSIVCCHYEEIQKVNMI